MTQSAQPQHMVTRFAPSPTGRLHVGHAWSALLAMDLAHARGGSFRLRIEDIDGTRSRPEHVDGIVEDMRRSEEHTSELQSLMRTSYAVFSLTKKSTTNSTKRRTNSSRG